MNDSVYYTTTTTMDQDDTYMLSDKTNKCYPCKKIYPMALGIYSFDCWYKGVILLISTFITELLCSTMYYFIIGVTCFHFPGFQYIAILIKICVFAGSRYFIAFTMTNITGGYLDPWVVLYATFTELFYCTDQCMYPESKVFLFWQRMSVFGKTIFILIADILGAFIGIALISLVTGYVVRTTDCVLDISPSCVIRPTYSGIGLAEGRVTQFMGYLIIFFSYVIATSIFKNGVFHAREKKTLVLPEYITWGDFSSIIAAGYFVSHIWVMYYNNGYSLDVWYWLVTSAYTNNFDEADIYPWPGLVAGLVTFVIFTIFFFLNWQSVESRNKME